MLEIDRQSDGWDRIVPDTGEPELVLSEARIEGTDQDAVLLLGAEPNLRWRTFCETILVAARELGVAPHVLTDQEERSGHALAGERLEDARGGSGVRAVVERQVQGARARAAFWKPTITW